jgi:site-specific DNA-methyltransferase (adenine-specific)/site-specific DNA-methyltransferase (cytosine-N4-specific)
MDMKTNIIYKGLSERLLKNAKKFPDDSIDLIVTSPPYSDRRKNTYGGVGAKEYVDWILPITGQLFRIISPTGSLVLNIKEHVEGGERQTYVLETILGMKKQGWRWVEEYCWYKKTAFPGKWNNRFRDSFERCLHFTKNKDFYMDQDAVKVPIGDWAEKRFKSMTKNDFVRYTSANNNHLGRNVSNWLDKQTVYPHNVIVLEEEHYSDTSNVLEISPVTGVTNHSACFPIELPTWFIALFSKIGDLVLDPFSGIGTTAKASILLGRQYIGIEKEQAYVDTSRKTIKALIEDLAHEENDDRNK